MCRTRSRGHCSGMDLDNPIALRLTIDADHLPLRGVLERVGHPATEFQGQLQLLELLGRLTDGRLSNPSITTSRTSQ